jgi:hypothetical protein
VAGLRNWRGCERLRVEQPAHHHTEGFELMFDTNFRNAYEFDPETYGGLGPDDLAVLLRQVMLQHDPQQRGIGSAAANAASGQDPESYGNPKGLPGRIRALQEDQPEVFRDAGQQQYPPPDTNFGQLPSAIAPMRTPGTVHLSSRFEGQPNSTYPVSGEDASPDASPMTAQGAGSPENRGASRGPIRVADASMNMTPFAWRGTRIPIPVPVPPMGPVTIPEIPMPRIPDWWRAVAAWLKLYHDSRGQFGGGGGDDDYRRCMRAAARDSEDWDDFCENLKPQLNNTAGVWSAIQDCRRKSLIENDERGLVQKSAW